MMLNLDKYARVARAWRDWAKINCVASQHLFFSGNPILYFPAATLGHHALEMYLKAALITQGMTVFNPDQIKLLDVAVELKRDDCIWGHSLVGLAEELAKKHPDFDLKEPMQCSGSRTVRQAFAVFDPFFSELR